MNECSWNSEETNTATCTGRNWNYVIPVEVVMIAAVPPWDRKSDIYDTSQRKRHNCRSVTTEVLNLTQHRMRMWTSTPEGLGIFSWWSTGSLTLLAERTLLQTMVYACFTRNYEAPMFWSFDTLPHLTVTSISKTTRHRTYVAWHVGFVSNKEQRKACMRIYFQPVHKELKETQK